jgi:pyrrolysine biosynthesis protein PylD
MTRLITEWIKNPVGDLEKYDSKLLEITGMGICETAFKAAGTPFAAKSDMKRYKVAVVRVSAGEGVIGSFAEAVAAVISHMGAQVFITKNCDVAGIYEGLTRGAEILFMADDDRFIAFNVKTGALAENDDATAFGYVAALSFAAGGLTGKNVMLLGFGRLGKKAHERLVAEGAHVKVFEKGDKLPLPLGGLVFDATDEGKYLSACDISDDILIAAPGVPLSLDDEAHILYKDRVIHDPLHLGAAVMLAMTLKTEEMA